MNSTKENKTNQIIDDKINNGYELDLGNIIDNSIEIYKKIVWKAGLGYFMIFGIIILIAMTISLSLIEGSNLEEFKEISQDPNYFYKNPTILAWFIIGGLIINILFIPLNAGFLNLCRLARTNQEFSTANIFDYYKSKYLKDLIIGSLLIAIVTTVLTTVLDMSNLKIVSFVIQISFALFTFLFLPLVIYGNQSFGNAIKKSIQLVMKSPFTILGAMIIGILFILVGLIGLCIGILFTIPFYSCVIYTLYESIIGFENETIN
ncbi:hypothetical protein [Flavobacterium sp.]|uniref:hypothetical protein n=1 Tax=Flavobacterium sp. TaxID=239 RepID=UPI003D270066